MNGTNTDESIPVLSAPIDPEKLAMLHRRLEAAAQAEGPVDVAYTTVDSPVGKLLLATTPVVVPCHRVLRTDGSLGGSIGGLEAENTLLELEAA